MKPRVQGLAERGVVLGPAASKSAGRSSSGLRHLSAPTTQISLQRSLSRSVWKTPHS